MKITEDDFGGLFWDPTKGWVQVIWKTFTKEEKQEIIEKTS